MEFSFEYGLLGLFVGLVSSLLGLGGSVLIIPILPSLAPLTFREVIATSLFSVALITFSNSVIYQLKKLINWKQVLTLFPLVSLGSFLSARNSHHVEEKYVKTLLIFVMLAMFYRLIKKGKLPFKIPGFESKYFLPGVGFCTGLLSGLVGIGGGVILTPTFMIKKVMDHKRISPTINCLIFLGSLTAVLGYMDFNLDKFPQMGAVHTQIGFTLFIFAFMGSLIGIRLNSKISEPLRKKVFSAILLILAVKLIFV